MMVVGGQGRQGVLHIRARSWKSIPNGKFRGVRGLRGQKIFLNAHSGFCNEKLLTGDKGGRR